VRFSKKPALKRAGQGLYRVFDVRLGFKRDALIAETCDLMSHEMNSGLTDVELALVEMGLPDIVLPGATGRMLLDRETMLEIQELDRKKAAAVESEDFQRAKKLRGNTNSLSFNCGELTHIPFCQRPRSSCKRLEHEFSRL
jgi:hypothetical protein